MIHDIWSKNFKNFFNWKKIQLQVSKSGVFSEKKIKIPLVRRPFFESKSEAKCPEKPLANFEKLLVMTSLPPSLPKKFLWFLWKFTEMKFRWKKFAVFWKILKNLFFCGKKSNFNFQNRGYFGKKMFRKFLESSVIISLKRGDSRYFGKKFQKLF